MIFTGRIVCRLTTGEVFTVKNGKKKQLKPAKSNNYLEVKLSWKGYRQTVKVHQILWLYQTLTPYDGRKNCIDHKDGDRMNNSISNLRLVDYSENAKNRKKRRNLIKSELEQLVHLKKNVGYSFAHIAEVFDINEASARRAFNRVVSK
jgi:hypothetical protein